jgi:hypothetical protein
MMTASLLISDWGFGIGESEIIFNPFLSNFLRTGGACSLPNGGEDRQKLAAFVR